VDELRGDHGVAGAFVQTLGGMAGMLFALSALPCMVAFLCNFDIPNTTFTFLTKLNRGPRFAV
jgi:molybdopterin-guanine dinucleotide biosynthesis protein A